MRRALVPLLAALAGGALGAGIVLAVDDDPETRVIVDRPAPIERGTDAAALDAASIYRRDAPGVVFVIAEVVEPVQTPFDFGFPEQRGQATGSGFVIDDDGNILTNAHVVENATNVVVRFSDQRTARAEIRGRDRSSDLALLKVDPEGLDLKPLELGTSKDVRVGDPTVAIGNPFGLERTLTTGVVSALQRRIEAPDGFTISNVIQTDAAINPGNSGGPLIDANGEVIGINSAIRTGGGGEGGNIGIGFAVPIDTAKRVLPTLKEGEDVERAYLGVTSATVTPEMDLRVDRGAVVSDVAPLSPAGEAGLRPGDVIVRFAGEDVASTEDVSRLVDEREPGDDVELEVVRAGRRERVEVELGKRPTVGG
ncbi:MAG TPA: trypsin-like peptidase domain-containing protein [Solirubrobacteraceae bacterium]|nr:trypsin-like peptidase domain-containing protein [Solirubrobacteraceae bacterium]